MFSITRMNFEVGQQNATFCHCSHCDQLCVCVWIPYGGVHLLLDRAEKHYDAEIAKAFSNMGFPYDRIP
ncbi:hypothetical protein PC116_g16309 [Phytophthora cactorum]|uniref:Uncharacterized protein n=1 Tax=Phytophthora cactorum TaxID=29920 RepID=A0A8T1KJK3_9STRA|nr:hypothetical protein PC111_g11249 [Phytophthora cactorum]KAG2932267.1 hypothetical protein PC117_g13207 [Phytophthora cactorum]KAG4235568.1 hypothetical protein PC116_g16309 [Phytophthora cactorum]